MTTQPDRDLTTEGSDSIKLERRLIIWTHLSDCAWHLSRCKVETEWTESMITNNDFVGPEMHQELRETLEDKKRAYWSIALVFFFKALPPESEIKDQWLTIAPRWQGPYEELKNIRNRFIAHDGPTGAPLELDINRGRLRQQYRDALKAGVGSNDIKKQLKDQLQSDMKRATRHYPSFLDIATTGEMCLSALNYIQIEMDSMLDDIVQS